MRRLALTLPTPAENLALDEALLELAEQEGKNCEFLRIWESPEPIVVVGRSTRVGREVDRAACRERGIAILRRSSGGAAIVAGRGCLMYAVVLSYALRPELRDIRAAHSYVLDRLADALCRYGLPVARAGTSDLVIQQPVGGAEQRARKFSGNSLRAKRTHMLYHGTLLYGFELRLIEECLAIPPRVPDYRAGRAHADFLQNLLLDEQLVRAAVDAAWPTEEALADWPRQRVEYLVAERFAHDGWNFEFE